MKKNTLIALSGCLLTGAVMGIIGCRGSTSNDPIDNTGTQYDPNKAGTVSIDINGDDHLPTGTMVGFRVFVKDSNGAPAIEVPVSCDTEAGLALIEPNSGKETTDAGGEISGKLGCNNPGSYLLACRAASSARTSTTIVCVGNRPTGFSGFPNAGGGGLGGGSANNNVTTKVRVTNVSAYDQGDTTTATTSIDIQQDACGTSGTTTPEKFYDTQVGFTVINDTQYLVSFDTLQYTVSNASASGASVTSKTISLTNQVGATVDANGGTSTFTALFLDANGSGKRIYGSSSNLSLANSGFKNVTFTLTGSNELGETITVKGASAFSFDDFNNCD